MNAASPRKLTSGWNFQKLIASVVLLASCHWAVAQPLIKTHPANITVSLGATAQFTVSATSTHPPVTYQWWFKDAALDAVTNRKNAPGYVVTCADYDGDGWVDVAIASNRGYSYGTNALLHNLGAGRFEVVTNTPVAVPGAYVENLAWKRRDRFNI